MENKNGIGIGYLEVMSWEHFALTGERFCYDVDQLEWLLPEASTKFFKSLLTLQQEVCLSDCISLSPLVDKNYAKRNIYIKSDCFKKPLTEKCKEFFETELPVGGYMADYGEIYFPQYFSEVQFDALTLDPSWDEFVLTNSGYSPGRYHDRNGNGFSYNFWVPKSDEQINRQYGVIWRKHIFHDKIFEQIFGNEKK